LQVIELVDRRLAELVGDVGDLARTLLADVVSVRIRTLATLIDCPQSTIRHWIRSGVIPATRIGGTVLVRIADVRGLLQDHGIGSGDS
jgi:excisionase family DNA binding protein